MRTLTRTRTRTCKRTEEEIIPKQPQAEGDAIAALSFALPLSIGSLIAASIKRGMKRTALRDLTEDELKEAGPKHERQQYGTHIQKTLTHT